jgi:hypothetical protein
MNKLSTMAKIRTAFSRRNLLATMIGAIKGGAIPFGTFALYHLEMGNDPWQAKGLIVLGGLVYSAKTVFGWCKQVFRKEDGSPDTLKALGWCVGIEGFMTCSSTFWLNCAALALLIAVNAVATGVSLAMEDEAAKAAEAATKTAPTRDVEAELAAVRAEVTMLQATQAAHAATEADRGVVVVPAKAARKRKIAAKHAKSAKSVSGAPRKDDVTVN